MSLLLLIYCNFKISWFCFFAHYDIILFSFLMLMFYHYSALSSHTAAAECTFRNVLICHLGHQLPKHIPTTIQSNDLVNWVVLLLKLKFLSTAMFLNVTNLKNWDTDVAEHHKGSDVCFLSDLSIGRWRKDKASWWFSLVGCFETVSWHQAWHPAVQKFRAPSVQEPVPFLGQLQKET